MSARTTLAAGAGVLALLVGLSAGGIGLYLAWDQPRCTDASPDGPTNDSATGESGTDDTCLPLYSWTAIGGGMLALVGVFALLYAWIRFAYG